MFSVTEGQHIIANNFIENHSCSLENDDLGGKKIGAIGGRVTWSFTPTGLGVIIEVKCACGKYTDVTDYGHW